MANGTKERTYVNISLRLFLDFDPRQSIKRHREIWKNEISANRIPTLAGKIYARFTRRILVDLPPGGPNFPPRKLQQSCLPRRSTNFVIVYSFLLYSFVPHVRPLTMLSAGCSLFTIFFFFSFYVRSCLTKYIEFTELCASTVGRSEIVRKEYV